MAKKTSTATSTTNNSLLSRVTASLKKSDNEKALDKKVGEIKRSRSAWQGEESALEAAVDNTADALSTREAAVGTSFADLLRARRACQMAKADLKAFYAEFEIRFPANEFPKKKLD